MDRRKFLRMMGMAGAAAALPWQFNLRNFKFAMARAYPFAQSPTGIRKFITNLPGLGPGGANQIGQYIPLATKTSQNFAGLSTDVYSLAVSQFTELMHPDLPGKTTFWGYADNLQGGNPQVNKYLGGVVVATRKTPVMFKVTNMLPNKPIIPVDPTVMAGPNGVRVGDLPFNRIATHLHGGLTPWFSDGTPFQWFTPGGMTGASFMNVPGTNPPTGTATYYYPMDLSARLLWYHDHAVGITRTNAYSGIASALVLTDDFETYLVQTGLVPALVGVPLVIQDKTFVAKNILTQDPSWPGPGKPGDLWYPHVYEPNFSPPQPGTFNPKGRWDYGLTVNQPFGDPGTPPDSTGLITPLPTISLVPEYFSDTAMVNGAPYPVVNVNAQCYRFRMLNASQARFWHLNLYVEDPANPGEPMTTVYNPPIEVRGVPGPTLYQIATEGGFLPKVAIHDNITPCPRDLVSDPSGNTANPDGPFNLLLAPAERADVLIDFTGFPIGSSFILYSDAPAPFPGGDPRNDYYTGAPDHSATGDNTGGAPTTQLLHGPNTRTLMRITVISNSRGPGLPNLSALNMALANNFAPNEGNQGVAPQQPALLANPGKIAIPAGATLFNKTLNEDFDNYGRLIQMGGTGDQNGTNNEGMITFGRGYLEAPTETPEAGEVQVWDVYNTTGDTHPWHFHLVNVQIIGRGIFATQSEIASNGFKYTIPVFKPGKFTDLKGKSGQLTPPDDNELGWKETVRMNPGEVTRVIMKFDLPALPAALGDPGSPRFANDFPGQIVHEYVHHCHILEHEEHDMMRPLLVLK